MLGEHGMTNKYDYAICVEMIKLTLDVSRSTDSSRAVSLGVAKTQVTALVLAYVTSNRVMVA
jgi:hypothetical protein